MYCKCSQYWWRHFKEDSILLSNFVIEGRIIGLKKENEKSFYSLILLEQRFPLKIFLAKYVRILVKSVQLGYSSGNFSDPARIYQRIVRWAVEVSPNLHIVHSSQCPQKAPNAFQCLFLDVCTYWPIHTKESFKVTKNPSPIGYDVCNVMYSVLIALYFTVFKPLNPFFIVSLHS